MSCSGRVRQTEQKIWFQSPCGCELQLPDPLERYQMEYLSVLSGGANVMPTASIKMSAGEEHLTEAAVGNGPVDALYKAIYKLTGYDIELKTYEIKAKGQGIDALGQVSIIVEYKGKVFHGMGLATDIRSCHDSRMQFDLPV